jgi:hypothetical protein
MCRKLRDFSNWCDDVLGPVGIWTRLLCPLIVETDLYLSFIAKFIGLIHTVFGIRERAVVVTTVCLQDENCIIEGYFVSAETVNCLQRSLSLLFQFAEDG